MDFRIKLIQQIRDMNKETFPNKDYEYMFGYKEALCRLAEWLHEQDFPESEQEKFDEVAKSVIRLNPSQETCKKLIEFLSEHMTRKKIFSELLDPIRHIN